MIKKKVYFVIWFPHSGGRFFNREILTSFDNLNLKEIFHPFLLYNVDQILRLDTTEQVHKHRSIDLLRKEFLILKKNLDICIEYSLKNFFKNYNSKKKNIFILPCGSSIAKFNFKLIKKIFPKVKFVLLMRNPLDCFKSFKKRMELNGDYKLFSYEYLTFHDHIFNSIKKKDLSIINYDEFFNEKKIFLKIKKIFNLKKILKPINFSNYYGINLKTKNLEVNEKKFIKSYLKKYL